MDRKPYQIITISRATFKNSPLTFYIWPAICFDMLFQTLAINIATFCINHHKGQRLDIRPYIINVTKIGSHKDYITINI